MSALEACGAVVELLHGTTSDHFLWSAKGKKREKVSEVCQQVSASLGRPEPSCKTASVPVPSPFVMAGWPREEGARQIFILLGEGRLAGGTPELGGKGGPPSYMHIFYAGIILSGEPHT